MSFVHLHTHSHYSLLDGLGTISGLVAAAKEMNMPALALTDHGVMYGAIEFYKACHDKGIKPIIGIEGYLTDGSLKDRDRTIKPYHLILLAATTEGYHNLLKLTSEAHLHGFYYKPRFDWETLAEHKTGLIALTGCLNGPLSRHLASDDDERAEANLKRLLDIFTTEDLYLEMQARPSLPAQSRVNEGLKRLSKRYGVGLVATNDVHYIRSSDATAHDVLICMQTKSHVTDKNRMSYLGEDYSLLSPEEMRETFKDVPEAIENTVKIAERCNAQIALGKINLPFFAIPDNKTSDEYLQELSYRGVERRYKTPLTEATDTVRQRLDYELDVIKKTGFADYFLIVQDFVNWAKNNGIMVGPGRGSAAGSIVSYLTGITNVDPLQYELLFERFLNPERVSMPDIDMDFADTERDRVLRYVEQKYGHDHVAQIITFGTMAARAAIRDVGRALGLSYGFCDRIAKLIPQFTSLKEAVEKIDEITAVYRDDPEAKRLIDMAQKLEGIARHTSTHACAVLITKDPLINHVPLQYSSSDDSTIISQYSMYPVEALGLLKMDFLGLTNLTILQTAAEIIAKTTGDLIDFDTLPLNDRDTFTLLQRGETTGIFQLESDGMTRYLKKLKPNTVEDIIAMVALYRPGPMEFIEDFIAGKHGKRQITYVHPKLAPILEKTYGIAVYQEQVLQIARDLAGFSYGEADILRKAVGKKIKKLLVEQEEKMIKGMVANGIDQSTAQQIWDFILPFARYGFNRAHAASYALIAYQTAFLKAHYPSQFMAALLTSEQGNTERIAKEVHECQKMSLVVLPPDVNESFTTFSVVVDPDTKQVTKTIRFGLNAVKNVGEHIAKVIIHERKGSGPYSSLEDFLRRIGDKDLNKKSLESLVKCGALDCFGDRATFITNLDNLLAFHKKIQDQQRTKQNDLFADLPLASAAMKLKLDDAAPLSVFEKLTFEKELLGLYISDHPFKKYVRAISRSTHIADLVRGIAKSDSLIRTAGIVTLVKKIVTKTGKPMLFVQLEDSTGSIELIVFPRLYELQPNLWQENTTLSLTGKMTDKDDVPKIIVESADVLDTVKLDAIVHERDAKLKLWLNLPHGFARESMDAIRTIIERFPGKMPVYVIINNGEIRKVKANLTVINEPALLHQLIQILGEENVTIDT